MPQPKGRGPIRKQGGPFVIAVQTTPSVEDEVIVGIAAGLLLPQEMDQHGLETQSAETAEAFALHQAIKWAFAQTGESWHPVTIYYDCAGAGDPAAGKATASAETKKIARATRALVHYAESHGVHIKFTHVHSHRGHASMSSRTTWPKPEQFLPTAVAYLSSFTKTGTKVTRGQWTGRG